MEQKRANASVIAILIILVVIAGVLYLFWQNRLAVEEAPTEEPSTVEEADSPAPDEATPETEPTETET